MQDRVQNYAKAAKDLFSSVAKLAVTQANEQLAGHQLLQASASPSVRATVPIEARISRFKQQLLASRIDLDELRRLSMQGIPDKDGLRAITWKLLLGYLPPNPDEWDEVLARRRTQYVMFCQDLIVDPKKAQEERKQWQQQQQQPPSSAAASPQQQQQQQQQQQRGPTPVPQAQQLPPPQQQQQQQASDPLAASSSSFSADGAPGQQDVLLASSSNQHNSSSSSSSSHPLDPLARTNSSRQLLGTAGASSSSSTEQQQQHPLGMAGSSNRDSSSSGSSSSSNHKVVDPLLQVEEPEDHPLSLQSTSKWHTFFKDNEIMAQIDRDVMRTHPDMHFFSGDTPDAERHRTEMKRALFMYAKLNPGLRYIQGMNELLAPLYYMFSTDTDRTSARYAEADAFYCFVELLSEFRDHFCQQLDNSGSGIRATIGKLVALLTAQDPQLAEHLAKSKVDPQFFAFRWITLLLTQELTFPDAVRVWDTLLADPRGRLDCLLRVCLAMLLNVRQQLMEGDFATIVKLLQRYPPVDVSELLAAADKLPSCKDVLGGPL